jgi:hypothetical protein
VLETKYRFYEKEINEFFKSYDKFRNHTNRVSRKQREQHMNDRKKKRTEREQKLRDPNKIRHHFTEGDLESFCVRFKRFLEGQKIVINVSRSENGFTVNDILLP